MGPASPLTARPLFPGAARTPDPAAAPAREGSGSGGELSAAERASAGRRSPAGPFVSTNGRSPSVEAHHPHHSSHGAERPPSGAAVQTPCGIVGATTRPEDATPRHTLEQAV